MSFSTEPDFINEECMQLSVDKIRVSIPKLSPAEARKSEIKYCSMLKKLQDRVMRGFYLNTKRMRKILE